MVTGRFGAASTANVDSETDTVQLPSALVTPAVPLATHELPGVAALGPVTVTGPSSAARAAGPTARADRVGTDADVVGPMFVVSGASSVTVGTRSTADEGIDDGGVPAIVVVTVTAVEVVVRGVVAVGVEEADVVVRSSGGHCGNAVVGAVVSGAVVSGGVVVDAVVSTGTQVAGFCAAAAGVPTHVSRTKVVTTDAVIGPRPRLRVGAIIAKRPQTLAFATTTRRTRWPRRRQWLRSPMPIPG